MKRIVIIGGGFGGAYLAQELEDQFNPQETEVILIDRNNYFVFYPLLIEAGTGSLEPRHAVVSIRAFLKKTRFIMAQVEGVDIQSKKIRYLHPEHGKTEEISYDHLAIGLGSVTKLPPVKGLAEYGFEMKSMSDAIGLRDRAIRMLEAADAEPSPEKRKSMLHFVVVGGNFTGIELAGEMEMFLRRATRYYRNVKLKDFKITLIEIADRVLSAVDPELSEYAMEHLKKRGIEFRLKCSVNEIAADHVVLSTGERIPTETVVWCAGIAPNPLIAKLNLPVDDRGYILCDSDLKVQGHENIWAVGDCAVNLGPDGKPYPATAQHAIKEGRHLAKNVIRALKGQPTLPCVIESQGSLAALGCRTGVAKVFGLKLSGFAAWFLWRSVYLFKMPGWSRKTRVGLDWMLDLFFPRDIVQLGIHRQSDSDNEIKKGPLR